MMIVIIKILYQLIWEFFILSKNKGVMEKFIKKGDGFYTKKK